MRISVTALALSAAWMMATSAFAQPRADACFFANDFEGDDAFNGWDLGPQVERRTPEGEGLGEFVSAWTVGNAGDANAEGYFAVTDSPIGNRFAMANDAAAPCNCDMGDVALTSPSIDLTGRTGVALECRVFHDGLFASGPAVIEYSTVAGEWMDLDTLEAVAGQWQHLRLDLSGADGAADFRIRFRWSDGGAWAGGFAVDDICLRERLMHDLVVSHAQVGAQRASVYETGDQRLYYSQLPISQAAPVTVAAMVRNGGTASLHQVQLSAGITLNGNTYGPFTAEPIAELMAGEEREVSIATGWQPDAPGIAEINFVGGAEEQDDAPEDDMASGNVRFTGPGWDGGYRVMACDNGSPTASFGGTGSRIILNRMEVVNSGDQAAGVSVTYGSGTELGALVRAVLMDANFNTVDTSARRTLEEADMDMIQNGLPVFEAFTNTPVLVPGDYHVGIQQLAQEEVRAVQVLVGGEATPNRSVVLEGATFILSDLATTPLIRLHLEAVPVTVMEHGSPGVGLRLYPNPASDVVRMALADDAIVNSWSLLDLAGRTIRADGSVPRSGTSAPEVDLAGVPSGVYQVLVRSRKGVQVATLVIVR